MTWRLYRFLSENEPISAIVAVRQPNVQVKGSQRFNVALRKQRAIPKY